MIILCIYFYLVFLFIYAVIHKLVKGDLPSVGEMILCPLFVAVRFIKYIMIGIIFIIKEILFGFKELGKVIIDKKDIFNIYGFLCSKRPWMYKIFQR